MFVFGFDGCYSLSLSREHLYQFQRRFGSGKFFENAVKLLQSKKKKKDSKAMESFAGWVILGRKTFFFSFYSGMSLHSLLAFRVSSERSAMGLIGVPL